MVVDARQRVHFALLRNQVARRTGRRPQTGYGMPQAKFRPLATHAGLDLAVDVCLFVGLALGLGCYLVLGMDPAFLPVEGATAPLKPTAASFLLNAIPVALVAILLLVVTRRGLLSLSI